MNYTAKTVIKDPRTGMEVSVILPMGDCASYDSARQSATYRIAHIDIADMISDPQNEIITRVVR